MLFRTNTGCKIEDYHEYNGVFTLYTNNVVDLNILKESKTLDCVNKRIKTAKTIKIAPKESDFLYIRNRAVSSGNVIEHENNTYELIPIEEYYKHFPKYATMCRNANTNGDFFSHEELKNRYKTFIGKSVFVDHKNENVEDARGIILDAVYNENGFYVELLKAIDKKAFPQLASSIEKKYTTDTSMGCRCGYSICSICANKAHTDDDICEHILNYKGMTYNSLPVFEDNRDVDFFEDSIVTEGADPKAKILEKVASKISRNDILLPKYYSKKENLLSVEQNQRTFEGKIKNISDKLKMLPWT